MVIFSHFGRRLPVGPRYGVTCRVGNAPTEDQHSSRCTRGDRLRVFNVPGPLSYSLLIGVCLSHTNPTRDRAEQPAGSVRLQHECRAVIRFGDRANVADPRGDRRQADAASLLRQTPHTFHRFSLTIRLTSLSNSRNAESCRNGENSSSDRATRRTLDLGSNDFRRRPDISLAVINNS